MTRARLGNSVAVVSGAARKLPAAVAAAVLGLISTYAAAEAQSGIQPGSAAGESDQAPPGAPLFDKTVDIVVKFKDDTKIQHIVDAFWKAPESAKTKFDVFKQGRPELSAAVLARVTYSNELVLTYSFEAATNAQRRAGARAIAAKLAALPEIAYAEPDLSFQTQQ